MILQPASALDAESDQMREHTHRSMSEKKDETEELFTK
jgi:hypothetical protein